MSMTSKVKNEIRNAIIAFLKTGTTATNNGLKYHVLPTVSRRSIQEATQKLTKEGVLERSRAHGRTWYGIATTTVFPGMENVGVEVPVV